MFPLKHPGSFTLHNLHARMKQLLAELGASQSEIQRAMPAPSEVDAALKRRLAAATAAAGKKAAAESELLQQQQQRGQGHRRKAGRGEEPSVGNEDLDLRDVKRFKVFWHLISCLKMPWHFEDGRRGL
jgi:hypothetical protein